MSRLEIWRDIASAPRLEELEDVVAGRNTEAALHAMVSSKLSWKSAQILHSRRVPIDPKHPHKRRYEIDLIVMSQKQISAIEIKGWSGEVKPAGDYWIQARLRGGEIKHENPVQKNRKKLDALCNFLESAGLKIPMTRVSRVVFPNPNLSMPEHLQRSNEVISHDKLDRFLTQQKASGFGERFMMSVLQFCLEEETSNLAGEGFFNAISAKAYDQCVEKISTLETFDEVELLGGRTMTGDLRELRTNGKKYKLKNLPTQQEVSVRCSRNKLILFGKAVLGKGPLISLSDPFDQVLISPNDTILFHPAGQKDLEEIKISQITKFTRG